MLMFGCKFGCKLCEKSPHGIVEAFPVTPEGFKPSTFRAVI